jgi:hypothetical protein
MRAAINSEIILSGLPARPRVARVLQHFGRTKPNSLMKSNEGLLQETCHGPNSRAEKT